MQRLAIGIALCLASAIASAQSGAAYQWKDANGVTQYSSTPPPKGDYKVRAVNTQGASLETTEKPAEAAAAENPQCATARANLKLLGSQAGVQLDSDGDGKADKTLSPEERANQAALAEAAIKANCAAPATP